MLEVPLFVSEDALLLSKRVCDGHSVAKVLADRTSKASAQKWQIILPRVTQNGKLVSSKCDATCTIGLLTGSKDSYDEGVRNVS